MPALRAFGRRWHVASDDLPPFACAGLVFHFIFAVFLGTAIGLEKVDPVCSGMLQLRAYLISLLIIDALLSLVLGATAWVGMKGSILDHHLRHSATHLLHAITVLYILLLGASMYGTVTLCYMDCNSTTWNMDVFGKVAFGFHWAAVGVFLLASIITFNPFPEHSEIQEWQARCSCLGLLCCLPPNRKHKGSNIPRAVDRGGGGGGSSSREALMLYHDTGGSLSDSSVAAAAEQGLKRLQGTNHEAPQVAKFAAVFHLLFSHGDFTISDYATGLVLVNAKRKMQAQNVVPVAAQQNPSPPPYLPSSISQPPPPSRKALEDAVHYYRHSCAVYGWPMHMWIHLTRPHRCCNVCCGCCMSCTGLSAHPTINDSLFNVHRHMSIEAIQRGTGLDIATDLLYCSFDNKVEGLLPYYIALDRQRKEVVLAVRGSLSQKDVLTDFLCFPEKIDPEWITDPEVASTCSVSSSDLQQQQQTSLHNPPAWQMMSPSRQNQEASLSMAQSVGTVTASNQISIEIRQDQVPHQGRSDGGPYAHQGLLRCAYALSADLHRHRVLRAVLDADEGAREKLGHDIYKQDCRGWRLVIVGHSMGAGVAALLALHLRGTYPDLHCWAFAPPGGLLSPAAAKSMSPYCTSVIIGKDMIPRLNLNTAERLTVEIIEASAQCKISKTMLWLRTGKKWKQKELFKEPGEVLPEAQTIVEKLKLGMVSSITSQGMEQARCFLTPGNLLYYERISGKSKASPIGVFKPRWMSNDELMEQGMSVSKRMFSMHTPDFQMPVLQQALEEAIEDETFGCTIAVLDAMQPQQPLR